MIEIVYRVTKKGCGFYLFEEGEIVRTLKRGELMVEGLWSEGVKLVNENGEYVLLTDEEFFKICSYNAKRLYQ